MSVPNMHLAADVGDAVGVMAALVAGTDKDAKTPKFEYSALHYAAHNGYTDVAVVLLAAGANIEAEDNDGATPLILASEHGHYDYIEYLLENGANVAHRDKFGRTCMHAALEGGCDRSLVNLLELHGALVNDREYMQGIQPIHWAAASGNHDALLALIKLGAEVNSEDGNGETPLFAALDEGHEDVIETLLKSGADTISQGMHATHKAVSEGHFNVLKKLIEHGSDIDATAENQNTLLHLAVEKDSKDIAEWLILKGANPYLCNAKGITAIHLALDKGHRKLVAFMASKNKHLTPCEDPKPSTSPETNSPHSTRKRKYVEKND